MPLPRSTEALAARAEVSLIYLVGRVNQGIRREMRARLERWQLSVPEFTALSILRRRPALSNAQLARRTMVTPQTMIEILGGLERRGLVRRRVDPGHGRILRAELTEKSVRVLAEAEPAIEALQDEILDGLSDEQRAVATEVMLHAMQRLRSGLPARLGG
jgi:DNA-binding MarR family transcriptional regulator